MQCKGGLHWFHWECGNAAHSRIGNARGSRNAVRRGFLNAGGVCIGNAAMQRIRALVWIECKGGLHWISFCSSINDYFLTILIKILLYADKFFATEGGKKPHIMPYD